jgi:hypothetical protein
VCRRVALRKQHGSFHGPVLIRSAARFSSGARGPTFLLRLRPPAAYWGVYQIGEP